MRDTPLILVVDDQPDNRRILEARLASLGYGVAMAVDGQEAIDQTLALTPDLILLDVMMPKLDGLEVCRRLRADGRLPFIPIVLVTARSDTKDLVAGLEAGANDYLTKPVDGAALTARVRSMLWMKALHDQVEQQREELAQWNTSLEDRITKQAEVIERTNRLRRFLPAPIADQIMSSGDDQALLVSHRAEIAVLFADLRGFTAFAEHSSPDTVMAALNAFHHYAGPLIERHEGTLERFLGDGLVILFNAPVTCSDPAMRAVKLARDIHAGFAAALEPFQTDECRLGLGTGVAQGIATLGQIGFEGRLDYAAVGSVSNLAARLCDLARDRQILVCGAVAEQVQDSFELSALPPQILKGIARPVEIYQLG
jgi:class 3 adenylate cyclase/CheY-like chemotaxis protein